MTNTSSNQSANELPENLNSEPSAVDADVVPIIDSDSETEQVPRVPASYSRPFTLWRRNGVRGRRSLQISRTFTPTDPWSARSESSGIQSGRSAREGFTGHTEISLRALRQRLIRERRQHQEALRRSHVQSPDSNPSTDLNMTESNVSNSLVLSEMVDMPISQQDVYLDPWSTSSTYEVGSSSSSVVPQETAIPTDILNVPSPSLPMMIRNLEEEVSNLTNTTDAFPPFTGNQITELRLQMAALRGMHMRSMLNFDNMTYEDLLTLEERLGTVLSGLSEETILSCLKQRKFLIVETETPSEDVKCCICQEEYNEGEDISTLDCGHEFHTDCIKQWLKRKNWCPLCKRTAVVVPKKE